MSLQSSQAVPDQAESARPGISRWLVWIFGVWCGLLTVLATLAQALTTDPVVRAVLRMALGVVLFWIVGAGSLSLIVREPVQRLLQHGTKHWRLIFIVGATAMALLEEAVTTSMTNLAPLWGVSSSKAHVTASGNYLDVVLLHSVIVFVPMFIAWSWLLKRYAFQPIAVFLLYGLNGLLAESGTFGFNPLEVGFWVYVYGLMAYLPAHAAPPQREARQPKIGAFVLAIALPILCAIPVAIVVQAVHAHFFPSLP